MVRRTAVLPVAHGGDRLRSNLTGICEYGGTIRADGVRQGALLGHRNWSRHRNNGPTVICEASSLSFDQSQNHGFLQAPMTNYGSHWHAAVVDAAGNFQFEDGGNIGGSKPQNDLVLQYGQTYDVSGWTILPTSDGSRFTNDGTGHGMFVSIENVYPF